MGRDENVKIFQDTERLVKEKKVLADAVKYSTKNQILIPEYMRVADMMPSAADNGCRYSAQADVLVSTKRTYEAASYYRDKRVCVHNFASATNPGGELQKAVLLRKSVCVDAPLYILV